MKQFFKFMFASMAGFILTGILFMVFIGGIFSMLITFAGSSQQITVKPNSILKISFNQPIYDRASKYPWENFEWGTFKPKRELGLNEFLKCINYAKTDKNINGIYLELSMTSLLETGIATVEEIRNALIDFKKSGKSIISYSEVYSQKAYYVASVADKVYLYPEGIIEFKGLHTEIAFFKKALEKLEIEPIIIRHGKFKSAIEPLIMDSMSNANKEQIKTFVGAIWSHLLQGIAASRNLSVEKLNEIADQLLVQNAEDAVSEKLADEVLYSDEVLEKMKEQTGKDVSFIKLEKYMNANEITKKTRNKKVATNANDSLEHKENSHRSRDKIAVIYALGEIISGEGDEKTIGSDKLSQTIREAREDENIKAIVLRINSPGGSALASDVIWREVVLAKKTKPVIVSMGDVAASGGYYIACAADTIVAEPNTITGSIGVFGVLLNMQDFFNNKLGITFDRVKTNTYSDIGNLLRPISAEEYNIILLSIERIYDNFISKVAEGRNMDKNEVDSIGQGRVWSGVDAKRLGLVDVLGGLKEAIRIAAEMANIEDYRLESLPKQESPWEAIVKEVVGDVETKIMKEKLGENYKLYQQIESINNNRGFQARLPYNISIY